MIKIIIAHNQDNLPTAKYTDFIDLQGDLKKLPKENQEKLKNSIINYGIRFPAFIWQSEGKKYIVDAHQRKKVFAILEKEGWTISEVPYTNIFAKNKKEAAELLLQTNSRYGEYNPDTPFFEEMQIDLSFIENIEIPELDIKLEKLESEIVEDGVPEPPIELLSKTGDLWLCDSHRILCGDATKEADILKLMDGKKADMCFCDPPYGVDYDGGTTKREKLKGDENPTLYSQFLPLIYKYTIDKAPFYIFYADGDITVLSAVLSVGLEIRTNLIWNKSQAQYGALSAQYKQKHEPILYCHKKNIAPFWYGLTNEVSVWDIQRNNINEFHPTQKPVELPVRAIRNSSKENDIIADFFLDSGTTLIACIQMNRILYGTELEPKYIDVILDRYAKFTGDDPIRESDGVKWSELKKEWEEKE